MAKNKLVGAWPWSGHPKIEQWVAAQSHAIARGHTIKLPTLAYGHVWAEAVKHVTETAIKVGYVEHNHNAEWTYYTYGNQTYV